MQIEGITEGNRHPSNSFQVMRAVIALAAEAGERPQSQHENRGLIAESVCERSRKLRCRVDLYTPHGRSSLSCWHKYLRAPLGS